MASFPCLAQEKAHISWSDAFEKLLMSHLCIKCTLRDDIRDFKLANNAKDHGALDDIVIQIDFKNGEQEVIVCQLRYKQKEGCIRDFLNFDKYEKSYRQLEKIYGSNTKITAILFTNSIKTHPEDVEAKQITFSEEHILSIFNTNGEKGQSYQLSKNGDQSKFYQNCFIFSNQIKPTGEDELLIKDLEYSIDSSQLALIKTYFGNTSKILPYYSKSQIYFILQDILLNPIMYTKEYKMIHELTKNTLIIETFNELKLSKISKHYCHHLFQSIVTFIEKNMSKLPNYEWDDEISNDLLKTIITDKQLNLFLKSKQKYNRIKIKDLLFFYWTTGKIPLILNCLNSKTQKSIKFYHKYLSSNVSTVLITEFKMQGVFDDLTSINHELLQKIGDTNIQFQFQNYTLNEIIDNDINFIGQIDTDSFLKLLSENVIISSVSENLDFYIDRKLKTENNTLITEKELFECSNEQCKIIHGVAGIGKTTFLQNQVLKDSFKIYCNINTIQMPDFKDNKSIVTYIVDIFNYINPDENFKPFLEKLVMQAFGLKKLSLLFDGYDESNENPSKFLKIKKIPFLIATRSAKIDELKKELKAKTYELDELETAKQKQFITKYCEHENIDSGPIINLILPKLSETHSLNIFGIPLLIKIAISTCENFDIDQKWTLIDLFENFLEKHMKAYKEPYLRRLVEKLACSVFFDNDILEKLKIDTDDLMEDLNYFKTAYKIDDIISSVSATNELQFTHRTYAEFLCARYLNKIFLKSKNVMNYEPIIELLYSEELIQIRYFFDLLTSKTKPLHTAVLTNNVDQMLYILMYSNEFIRITDTDQFGRTILHLIMGYGNRYNYPHIVNGLKNISNCIETYIDKTHKQFAIDIKILNQILLLCINPSEDLFGNNPCKYGFYSNSYEFLNKYLHIYNISSLPKINGMLYFIYFIIYHNFSKLFEKCLQLTTFKKMNYHVTADTKNEWVKYYEQFKTNIGITRYTFHSLIKDDDFTILHLAIDKKLKEVITIILKNNLVSTDYKLLNGLSPLELANTDLDITHILKNFSETNISDSNFDTLISFVLESDLHKDKKIIKLAAQYCSCEVISFFIENGYNVEDTDNENKSLVHYAIIGHQIETLNLLISKHSNLNIKAENDQSIMHYAAELGNPEIIDILINNGCNVEESDKFHRTPIFLAVINKNISTLNFLISKNTDLKHKAQNDLSIMHYAAELGNPEIIDILIKNGCNVEELDEFHQTPIFLAVINKNISTLNFLISKNTDLKHKAQNDKSIMHYAAELGNPEIIDILINNGCNVEELDEFHRTPIFHAVMGNNLETLNFLISKNIDLKHKAENGQSIMHYAAKYGNLEIIDILIKNGCNVEELDEFHRTPIFLAVEGKNISTLKFLISKNTDLKHKAQNDESIMHYAARYGNPKIIDILIEKGCNVEELDEFHRTPIFLAVIAKNIETLNFLISKNIDLKHKAENDQSIMHYAAKYGNPEIIDILIKNGCSVE